VVPCSELLRYALGVARDLDYFHQQGVVLGDFTPDNITICEGEASLVDCKVSRLLGSCESLLVERAGADCWCDHKV
jgi:serine/threonine protein kinase